MQDIFRIRPQGNTGAIFRLRYNSGAYFKWRGAMSEIVLIFHFMIVLFFIAGFFIGLVWNQSMFRYIHAGCLGGITLLMVLRIPCPLTLLEESLRNQSYEGSFLATWLNRVLYLEWFDPFHVLIANVLFITLVLSSFWWHPVKKVTQK